MDAKLQMVYEVVERIAKDNSIDMPEVGYYESAEPNAFATGATKNSALVAVSTGLLNNMKDDEIRGVI
jgi:heat shock protein HtpX